MKSVQKVEALSAKRRITGQGMTEYIIVVALIAIACIGAVSIFGDTVSSQFQNMAKKLNGDTGTKAVITDVTNGDLGTYHQ